METKSGVLTMKQGDTKLLALHVEPYQGPNEIDFEPPCPEGCVISIRGNEPARHFKLWVQGNASAFWLECPHGYIAGWPPSELVGV